MNNYTSVDKIFHNFIFSSKLIQKSLYEIQSMLFKNEQNLEKKNHIFITGMPRSGSTVLLYYLYQSELFASLTYRDMPFVISPKLNFFNKKKIEKKERLHKDGLRFDLDTPEALDNVFFNLFNDKEINLELENYILSVLTKYKKKRYLSKNNNIFQKLDLILNILNEAIIIVPFRKPSNQSSSLLKQNLNFIKLHEKDKFSLKYMNDLGHFEFGKNHIPWFKPKNFNDTININYWLEQWLMYYSFIYEKYKSNNQFLFICHEKFCEQSEYRERLLNKVDINKSISFDFKNTDYSDDKNLDKELLNSCNRLYHKLCELF